MELLTEAEFDRRFVVRRMAARTMLKQAAELENDREAANLADEAQSWLRNLPDKDRCRKVMCAHCRGQSWTAEQYPIYHMNQISHIVTGPLVCTNCGAPGDERVTLYKVASGLL